MAPLASYSAFFLVVVFCFFSSIAVGAPIHLGHAKPARPASTGSCNVDPLVLKRARLNATQAYVSRVNYDIDTYSEVCDRYYTDDTSFVLRGVGSFTSLQVAKEYGYVLFNFSTPLIEELWLGTLHNQLDELSITWSSTANATANGDSDNIVQFWATSTVRLGPQFSSPGHFAFTSGGVRNYETLIFEPCTDRIQYDIVVNDPAMLPVYTAVNVIDVVSLCHRIMARCTGKLQQYESFEECVAFMNAIDTKERGRPEAACPYRMTSNSTVCRNFHATNAIVDPQVHCAHVGIDSPKCVDTCLPACTKCPDHSHCVATYATATSETAVYTCTCDDGYVAEKTDVNGATSCVPKGCTAHSQCGNPYGYCSSTTGMCACPRTFEWDSFNGVCKCPDGQELTWDIPASNPFNLTGPACKPPGGCLARQHCTSQSWNRVQCAATDPPSSVSSWLACQCNPGFIGGWLNECQCPYGSSRIFWSSTVQGEVCLAPGECTDNWHCGGTNTCIPSAGEVIGSCATTM